MTGIEDKALIDELRKRLEANHAAMEELGELTDRLEAVNFKLKEAERLKSHFLSNIRNEINNPLTSIMGFAFELKTGPVSAEHAVRNGRLIYDEAFELSFQMENIFMAAGLEAGEEAPALAQIDAAAVLSDVLSELEHRIHEKGIEIKGPPVEPLPFVVDPRFLQIILRNLVANAVEFSPRWGSVSIAASSDEKGLRIDIGDCGPGIDPADQDTVFDRFRQLDSGSCKRHRGHGLGLSICRELARLSGGEIGVRTDPGKGTLFSLSLPLTSGAPLSSAPDGAIFFSEAEEKF